MFIGKLILILRWNWRERLSEHVQTVKAISHTWRNIHIFRAQVPSTYDATINKADVQMTERNFMMTYCRLSSSAV